MCGGELVMSAKGGGAMRAAMALALGLLVGLCVACPGDPAQPTYKLENRRVHPLKIITRAAKGCARQLDLSDPDSYQGPVTQTLGAGHVVSMSWLWQQGHDPADEDPGGDGEPDAGGDVDPDAGTDSDGDAGSDADADAGNDGDAGSDAGSDARVRPYNPDEGCGAMWISLPEHDYEAVLAWDSAPYLDSEQDTWKYAVVIEGTKTLVGVHLPAGIRELEVPE
jgi:hypothetical protein